MEETKVIVRNLCWFYWMEFLPGYEHTTLLIKKEA